MNYKTYLVTEFNNLVNEIEELAKDFSPEMAEKYQKCSTRLFFTAIDLLKVGTVFSVIDEEWIIFPFDKSEFKVPLKKIKEALRSDEFDLLLHPSDAQEENVEKMSITTNTIDSKELIDLLSFLKEFKASFEREAKGKENPSFIVESSTESDAPALNVDLTEMEHLAYWDSKFPSIYNQNALNRDLNAPDIMDKGYLLVKIALRGTKSINDEYGFQKGDMYISSTLDVLLDSFRNEKIYRVYGDQFILLLENEDENIIHGVLKDIKKILMNDSKIISYAISSNSDYDNVFEWVKSLDIKLNSSKNDVLSQTGVTPVDYEKTEENSSSPTDDMSALMGAMC